MQQKSFRQQQVAVDECIQQRYDESEHGFLGEVCEEIMRELERDIGLEKAGLCR
jgi:hypothetical protein